MPRIVYILHNGNQTMLRRFWARLARVIYPSSPPNSPTYVWLGTEDDENGRQERRSGRPREDFDDEDLEAILATPEDFSEEHSSTSSSSLTPEDGANVAYRGHQGGPEEQQPQQREPREEPEGRVQSPRFFAELTPQDSTKRTSSSSNTRPLGLPEFSRLVTLIDDDRENERRNPLHVTIHQASSAHRTRVPRFIPLNIDPGRPDVARDTPERPSNQEEKRRPDVPEDPDHPGPRPRIHARPPERPPPPGGQTEEPKSPEPGSPSDSFKRPVFAQARTTQPQQDSPTPSRSSASLALFTQQPWRRVPLDLPGTPPGPEESVTRADEEATDLLRAGADALDPSEYFSSEPCDSAPGFEDAITVAPATPGRAPREGSSRSLSEIIAKAKADRIRADQDDEREESTPVGGSQPVRTSEITSGTDSPTTVPYVEDLAIARPNDESPCTAPTREQVHPLHPRRPVEARDDPQAMAEVTSKRRAPIMGKAGPRARPDSLMVPSAQEHQLQIPSKPMVHPSTVSHVLLQADDGALVSGHYLQYVLNKRRLDTWYSIRAVPRGGPHFHPSAPSCSEHLAVFTRRDLEDLQGDNLRNKCHELDDGYQLLARALLDQPTFELTGSPDDGEFPGHSTRERDETAKELEESWQKICTMAARARASDTPEDTGRFIAASHFSLYAHYLESKGLRDQLAEDLVYTHTVCKHLEGAQRALLNYSSDVIEEFFRRSSDIDPIGPVYVTDQLARKFGTKVRTLLFIYGPDRLQATFKAYFRALLISKDIIGRIIDDYLQEDYNNLPAEERSRRQPVKAIPIDELIPASQPTSGITFELVQLLGTASASDLATLSDQLKERTPPGFNRKYEESSRALRGWSTHDAQRAAQITGIQHITLGDLRQADKHQDSPQLPRKSK